MKKLIVLLLMIALAGCTATETPTPTTTTEPSTTTNTALIETFMTAFGESATYSRTNVDGAEFKVLKGDIEVSDEAKVLCDDYDTAYASYTEALAGYYDEFVTVLSNISEPAATDARMTNMIATFKTGDNYTLSVYDTGVVTLRIDLNNRQNYQIGEEDVAKIEEIMTALESEEMIPCWEAPATEA